METLTEFLVGKPSIYDIGFFVSIVLLLCVVLGINLRQIRHGKDIKRLEEIRSDDRIA